jgi:hypothetical protein
LSVDEIEVEKKKREREEKVEMVDKKEGKN